MYESMKSEIEANKSMWDSISAGDVVYSSAESEDDAESVELEEESEPENVPKESSERKKLRKTIRLLERNTKIDFVEADKEFVFVPGKEHDIKVWDVTKKTVLKRLMGHNGSIRGLIVQDLSTEIGLPERIIISASEDGTIRKWSFEKGKEVMKLETNNQITCMGVIPYTTFVAIGIDSGHLEVYDLEKERLYTKVTAHNDSIDALVVDDFHICTSVYDKLCSLKVWQLENGTLNCLYILEEMHKMEITAFALMGGNVLLLGDAKMPQLHLLRFEDEKKHSVVLGITTGHVQAIRVVNDVVLVSTVTNGGMIHLHMYLQVGFEHLITFHCKGVKGVSSITLIRYDTVLKFILGGADLAVLTVDDTEKYDYSEERIYRYNFTQRQPILNEDNKKNEHNILHEGGNGNIMTSFNFQGNNNTELAAFKISDGLNQIVKKENNLLVNARDSIQNDLNRLSTYPNRGRMQKLPPMSNIKEYNSLQKHESEKISVVRQCNIDGTRFWSSNPNVLSKFKKPNQNTHETNEMPYGEAKVMLEQLDESVADETVQNINHKARKYNNENEDLQTDKSACRNEESSLLNLAYPEEKLNVNDSIQENSFPQKSHSKSPHTEYFAENIRIIAKDNNVNTGKKMSMIGLGKKKKQQNDDKKTEPKRKRKCCIM